jgi:hypothetical protein
MARSDKTWARGVHRHAWPLAALAVAAGVIAFWAPSTEAHKGITSKYNYNVHIFPILRDRCAGCHYTGGPAPMSLGDWMQAVPWAESIREHLITEKMPPWFADPTGPAVRGGHQLPTKDLDMLLSWVVGGTPRFDEKSFVFVPMAGVESPVYGGPSPDWAGGPPDLKLQMPAAHTLPAGVMEADHEVTIPTGLKQEQWVRFVDLLPGERSMVRDAVISIENGPVLAAWVPGHQPIDAPAGAAFRVPAGANLRLKIHYKKNYNDEQNAKSDRSSVGLYFTDAPLSGRSIDALVLSTSEDGIRLGGVMKTGGRVVGFRPSFDQAYSAVHVEAVAPNGRRVTLLKLRSAQPQWYRRYWLQEPIEVPQGSRIEATATVAPPDELSIPMPARYPLQIAVEYVPQ